MTSVPFYFSRRPPFCVAPLPPPRLYLWVSPFSFLLGCLSCLPSLHNSLPQLLLASPMGKGGADQRTLSSQRAENGPIKATRLLRQQNQEEAKISSQAGRAGKINRERGRKGRMKAESQDSWLDLRWRGGPLPTQTGVQVGLRLLPRLASRPPSPALLEPSSSREADSQGLLSSATVPLHTSRGGSRAAFLPGMPRELGGGGGCPA